MCYNCGCGNPHDDMGDIDNITGETLFEFAQAKNIPVEDVKTYVFSVLEDELKNSKKIQNKDLEELFIKAAKAWGQSVSEAKKETYTLLRQELDK